MLHSLMHCSSTCHRYIDMKKWDFFSLNLFSGEAIGVSICWGNMQLVDNILTISSANLPNDQTSLYTSQCKNYKNIVGDQATCAHQWQSIDMTKQLLFSETRFKWRVVRRQVGSALALDYWYDVCTSSSCCVVHVKAVHWLRAWLCPTQINKKHCQASLQPPWVLVCQHTLTFQAYLPAKRLPYGRHLPSMSPKYGCCQRNIVSGAEPRYGSEYALTAASTSSVMGGSGTSQVSVCSIPRNNLMKAMKAPASASRELQVYLAWTLRQDTGTDLEQSPWGCIVAGSTSYIEKQCKNWYWITSTYRYWFINQMIQKASCTRKLWPIKICCHWGQL